MKKFVVLLASVWTLLGVVAQGSEKMTSWVDNFDEISPLRWKKIPNIAQIVAKDTLSAANRVMLLSPKKGQQYLLSTEKFVAGDMEVVFSARRPKAGQLYYYIGFHACEPWMKAACWVLIHNEVVNFYIKTPDGLKAHKVIGNIKNGVYHTLKISQSTGKVIVGFDDKSFTFDDPALVSDEPMYAFIGANTGAGAEVLPAELRVDYMRVSGGAAARRLVPRQISPQEKQKAPENAVVKSGNSSFAWDFAGGFKWHEIRRDGKLLNDPAIFAPVFAASINGKLGYSHEMELQKVEQTADTLEVHLLDKASRVKFVFRSVADRNGGVKMLLQAENTSGNNQNVQLIFPLSASLIAPGEDENTQYFFPWRGGLLGKVSADFSAEYGAFAWMQLMFTVNAAQGSGLMFYPLDTTGIFKGMRMLRKQNGTTLVRHMESITRDEYPLLELVEDHSGLVFGQYYCTQQLPVGGKTSSCEVWMKTFDGNWKTALSEYSQFMYSKMRPVAQPRWFRDSFTWLCAHPKFYYNDDQQRYVMSEKLAGGEHAAQLAFWDDYVFNPRGASQLERYQPGDFLVHRGRGGDAAFREEIDRVKSRSTNMTLYIDFRFCYQKTAAAKRYAKEWGVINKQGNYSGYLTGEDLYLMCFYDQDKWAKYIADTCERLVKDLHLDGIYLDELGSAFPCYNPHHNHVEKGNYPVAPQDLAKSMTMVRNAMKRANPEAALMTEHAASDYLTQFYDGSWDQTFFQRFDFVEKYYNDMQLCIFRFYFPTFKLSEWGGSIYHAKRSLFNGMAMDMGGAADKDEQRLYAQVMRENGDAFSGRDVEPIVPTTVQGLLANRFRSKDKVCYTFFNTQDKAVSGTVCEAANLSDRRWVELIRDEEIAADSNIRIAAGDVAVLGCFRKLLNVERKGEDVLISVPAGSGDQVIICEGVDDCHFHTPRSKRTELTLNNGQCRYAPRTSDKIIIKLLKDGYLADQTVLRKKNQ